MALIDLKRTKSDKSDSESMLSSEMEQEDYAWGLQIDLGNEELEKLGNPKMKVGDEFEITAKVRVKSVSERATDGGGEDRSAGLLIKAISMPDGKTAEDVLYNDK